MNSNPSCQPPYTITPAIVHLVARISETVGHLTVLVYQPGPLRLRRINRIRTIRGSLAIEGNTLSKAQVTAILEGKRVIAPPREVQEVRNAIAAYDRFAQWNPGAAAQRALAEFLDVDVDLLAGAGVDSQPIQPAEAGETDSDAWLDQLPTSEVRKYLKQIVSGQGASAERELKRHYAAWQAR